MVIVEAFKPMETINESAENPSDKDDTELSVNISLLVQEQMAKTPSIVVTSPDAEKKGENKINFTREVMKQTSFYPFQIKLTQTNQMTTISRIKTVLRTPLLLPALRADILNWCLTRKPATHLQKFLILRKGNLSLLLVPLSLTFKGFRFR